MRAHAEGENFALLDVAFPLHLRLDEALDVVTCGPVLERVCPEARTGRRFQDCFRIVTPRVEPDFKAICEQAFTIFFVELVDRPFTLKGQMVQIPSPEDPLGRQLLFLCSPVVHDLSLLGELELGLGDFSMYDSTVDLLILLRTKARALGEARAMAERLREEIAGRLRVEQALREVNQQLEQRVAMRTHELARSNERLRRQNAARRQVELQLLKANQAFEASIARLERQHQQVSLLNRMGDRLQACASVASANEVVAEIMPLVFPESSGRLCLRNRRRDRHGVAVVWGAGARAEHSCHGCCAVEQEQPSGTSSASSMAESQPAGCAGLARADRALAISAPLRTHAEELGRLQVLLEGEAVDPGDPGDAAAWQELATAAAEQLGFAVSNIELRESLQRQSLCDALTGLYNRRYLERALEQEVARADRSGEPLAVLMIDVDHFKSINDTWGHPLGDRLLTEFGAFLLERVRAEDIACRYGGEEFTLILRNTPREVALVRAESIREQVESELLRGESPGPERLTVSIGLAVHPDDGRDPVSLVARADQALYRAKSEGRNRVVAAS